MTESLAAWFAGWCAGRDPDYKLPPSERRARSHLSPRKTCVHCNKRQISQGKSSAGQYARKARMCRSCYEQWGALTELQAEAPVSLSPDMERARQAPGSNHRRDRG